MREIIRRECVCEREIEREIHNLASYAAVVGTFVFIAEYGPHDELSPEFNKFLGEDPFYGKPTRQPQYLRHSFTPDNTSEKAYFHTLNSYLFYFRGLHCLKDCEQP